ncbi:hypothetical protein V501_02341 [Pseudogymnoascus sp. VKM F-4519 (FW-2642)]|nr:hypothetical protein V501_02341 [Pseudogymnoascus sp. VKM F-4519 (FW-2642)]
MISIFLAEELERATTDIPDTYFLQYFCDSRRDECNTGVAILRGLLFQLLQLQPKLIDYILPRFEVEKSSLFTLETLWKIFEAMICDAMLSTVYCILDGLDECEESPLLVLLKKLEALFSRDLSSAHCLKLLVVTRDHPEFISEILSNFQCIHLDTHASKEVDFDVRHFIKVKVDDLSAKKNYPSSIRIVADQLTKYTWSEVEEALKNHFPPGLEELYARMLLQIRMDRRKTAAKILLWVTMTFRPLSLLELSTAIDIVVEPSASFSREEVMRDKVSHYGYFLTVTNDKVRLIHRSAKDYLLRKTPDLNAKFEFFRLKEEVGNSEIAQKCFDYLQNGALIGDKVDLASNSLHLKAFPLLSYAVLYWQHHANSLARSEYVVNPLHPFYNEKSQTFKSWLGTYWVAIGKEEPPNLFTPLHLASWFGILSLAENILSKKGLFETQKLSFIFKNWGGINKRDSYGRTALWAAASQGHESLVRLLLENGAEINLTGELERGSRVTALFCAAARGHIAVLQLLLKKGGNVHDESETLGYFRGTALVWAVGKGDKDVALLLIENKANWQAKCEFDGLTLTMLMMAAIGGNEAIVQLLLRKGAKIDEEIEIRSGFSATALSVAIEARNRAIVQVLLENGADIDRATELKHGSKVTALYSAASNGNEDMVRLLLQKGADAEAGIQNNGPFQKTALIAAALNGHEAVVQLLLKNEANIRANINRKVAPGTVALFVAARAQNEAAVQLLLRNGVDINTTMEVGDRLRVTALYVAATTGDEATAQILLKNGADIEAKIKLGSMFEGPAVWAPSFTGQEAVLDFLLKAAKKLQLRKKRM